jgi:hypothetical protein
MHLENVPDDLRDVEYIFEHYSIIYDIGNVDAFIALKASSEDDVAGRKLKAANFHRGEVETYAHRGRQTFIDVEMRTYFGVVLRESQHCPCGRSPMAIGGQPARAATTIIEAGWGVSRKTIALRANEILRRSIIRRGEAVGARWDARGLISRKNEIEVADHNVDDA